MQFIINTVVLLFFILNFLIMWQTTHTLIRKDWRSSFISAALYFGIFIWVSTEILSLFSFLSFDGIVAAWIIYDLFFISFLIYKYRKGGFTRLKIPAFGKLSWEYILLICILSVTFFLAIAYPPNNWDSMTYHLPRIEHWLQNKSIAHYYTSIPRQVISAPLAEIMILQGRALSGSDWLMNLVQWCAFGGTLLVISKISAHLGLNRKQQVISAIFFATLPMAILQASSTQTDVVEAFWTVCLAERFLAWRKDKSLHHCTDFGIALGLAILTKGTAYSFALPFVLVFAISCIKQYRKYMAGAIVAAFICLAINTPHYTRNYIGYQNPLGVHGSATISDFTPKTTALTFFSDIYTNIPIPLPFYKKINKELAEIYEPQYPHNSLSISSFKHWVNTFFGLIPFNEDKAKNPFHTLFIIIALVCVFRSKEKKYRMYASLVLACWCVFFVFIPWQPWITRLQTPLFALSAPLLGIVFARPGRLKWQHSFLYIICGISVLPLFFNAARPLLPTHSTPVEKGWISGTNLWNASRDRLVFNMKSGLYQNYKDACAVLSEGEESKIGLIIGADSWEYPLWRYLRNSKVKLPEISHQKFDSISDGIEKIFLLDAPSKALNYLNKDISNIEVENDSPMILQKAQEHNMNGWDIIYPK